MLQLAVEAATADTGLQVQALMRLQLAELAELAEAALVLPAAAAAHQQLPANKLHAVLLPAAKVQVPLVALVVPAVFLLHPLAALLVDMVEMVEMHHQVHTCLLYTSDAADE